MRPQSANRGRLCWLHVLNDDAVGEHGLDLIIVGGGEEFHAVGVGELVADEGDFAAQVNGGGFGDDAGNRDSNIIQCGDAGFVGGHPNGLAGGGGQCGENKRGGGHPQVSAAMGFIPVGVQRVGAGANNVGKPAGLGGAGNSHPLGDHIGCGGGSVRDEVLLRPGGNHAGRRRGGARFGEEMIRLIQGNKGLGVAGGAVNVLRVVDTHGLVDGGVQNEQGFPQSGQVGFGVGFSQVL